MQTVIHYDYAIGLPPRWMDGSVVVLLGPPNENYSPSITITRDQLNFPMNAQEYAANQLASLQAELGDAGYKVLEEGSLTLGGLLGYQRVHTFQMREADLTITQLQIYLVRGNEALVITCTQLGHLFEQTRPLFLEALQQFRWQPQVPISPERR